eukprot:1335287-Rhodomonas_salina.4
MAHSLSHSCLLPPSCCSLPPTHPPTDKCFRARAHTQTHKCSQYDHDTDLRAPDRAGLTISASEQAVMAQELYFLDVDDIYCAQNSAECSTFRWPSTPGRKQSHESAL